MIGKSNLDVLRTIAVTLVVVDHLFAAKGIEFWRGWHIGNAGLFGVYLFFVHTSLVLMWSLDRRPSPLDFYIRRIFRIYPLAIIAILIAAATHAPVAGQALNYFHANQISRMGLFLNCLLITDVVGRRPLIHGVTWSLGPEIYMYILLPCLFFYARHMKKVWPLLCIWLLVVVWMHRIIPIAAGNVFPVLIPDFIAGIVAYVGFKHSRECLPSWTLYPILLVLLVVYLAVPQIRVDWYACLIIGMLLPLIRQVEAEPTRQVAHYIATYSYGIYLFHPFTIVLGMDVLGRHTIATQLAAILLPLVVISYVSYRFIEAPLIRLGAQIAERLAGERKGASLVDSELLDPAP